MCISITPSLCHPGRFRMVEGRWSSEFGDRLSVCCQGIYLVSFRLFTTIRLFSRLLAAGTMPIFLHGMRVFHCSAVSLQNSWGGLRAQSTLTRAVASNS